MKQYIDKSALIAEIKRITDEQQEICKADVALGKAPDSKNIEIIYQFQQFTKFLNTLEVKEIDVDIDSPEGDYNSKTVQFIDADGNIKEIIFNKAQNEKSALEAANEEKVDNQNCVKLDNEVESKFKVGDKVYELRNGFECTIESIDETTYYGDTTNFDIKDQDNWELVEQKSADKVEPKFKVGDEIKTANEESLTITKIDEKGYWSEDLFICGFEEECIWNLVEKNPAWSEEDEQYLLVCKNALAKYQTTDKWDARIISRWLENKLKAPQTSGNRVKSR